MTGIPIGSYNSILWNTGDTTLSITASQVGTYGVTVSADFCGSNAAEYILDPATPEVSINAVGDICEDGEETLGVTGFNGPINGYLWSTNEITDTIFVNEQGNYSVTVTTTFCGDAIATYDNICDLEVSVPNVFTPDGDDENDTFRPFFNVPSTDFVEYRFCVYSRWGEKVFETTNPDEAWDGKYKNELAVSDVYIWTLEGRTALDQVIDKDPNGKEVKSGDVTLLR